MSERTVRQLLEDLVENTPCSADRWGYGRGCVRGQSQWCSNCYNRWIALDALAALDAVEAPA